MVELYFVDPHGNLTTKERLHKRLPGFSEEAIKRYLLEECKPIRFEQIKEDDRCE